MGLQLTPPPLPPPSSPSTHPQVNMYLSSIKQYMYTEDEFNWNYGIALAAVGNYAEAEDTLLHVQSTVRPSPPPAASTACYHLS